MASQSPWLHDVTLVALDWSFASRHVSFAAEWGLDAFHVALCETPDFSAFDARVFSRCHTRNVACVFAASVAVPLDFHTNLAQFYNIYSSYCVCLVHAATVDNESLVSSRCTNLIQCFEISLMSYIDLCHGFRSVGRSLLCWCIGSCRLPYARLDASPRIIDQEYAPDTLTVPVNILACNGACWVVMTRLS